MLNGCAHRLDLDTRNARRLGETKRRIYLLSAWRETDLYTEQERAALALTEAMTLLPGTQDVPDEVYAQVTGILSEEQYRAVAWTITITNAFNRLSVASTKPLPADLVPVDVNLHGPGHRSLVAAHESLVVDICRACRSKHTHLDGLLIATRS